MSEKKKRKRKPPKKSITMAKVPMQHEGLDLYAGMDANSVNTLGGRSFFEAMVPVAGRSLDQNALWAVWYPIIGRQTGQTGEEVRRECKLNLGIPILLEEDYEYRRVWDAKFANDSYKQQLYIMRWWPVTRLFSKYQGMDYTETLVREYAEKGIVLEIL